MSKEKHALDVVNSLHQLITEEEANKVVKVVTEAFNDIKKQQFKVPEEAVKETMATAYSNKYTSGYIETAYQSHLDGQNAILNKLEVIVPLPPAYDSTNDTLKHIKRVNELMCQAAMELIRRATVHDNSKLLSPEKEIFDEMTPKLAGSTYGSDEYKEFLVKMKPALDHHYANNRHHPEHWKNGINGMDLYDILEMFFDWKAAGERHGNGNIYKSIDINKDRFKMSEQLCDIYRNTADRLGYGKPNVSDNKTEKVNGKNHFVFDVESTSLHGIGFAFGAVVINPRNGLVIDKLQLLSVIGKETCNEWVVENVLPHLGGMPTCNTLRELRDSFYEFYMKHKDTCEIWSDCNFPVETNFLSQVVSDNPKEREFNMPYPLKDICSIVDISVNRDEIYTSETGNKVNKHNPLYDSLASGYCLVKELNKKN
jgi:hypothetical protein